MHRSTWLGYAAQLYSNTRSTRARREKPQLLRNALSEKRVATRRSVASETRRVSRSASRPQAPKQMDESLTCFRSSSGENCRERRAP